MSEDKELKKLIRSGDLTALTDYFSILYTKYYKLVCFAISKYVQNNEDIEDLANDSFIKVFNNIYSIDSSFKYYLLKTANNVALDFLKKKKLPLEIMEVEVQGVDNVISSMNYNDLISKLNNCLKPIEVEVIIKHALEGYTFNELAKELNFKEKKVSSMYFYAIKKFINSNGVNL